MIETATLGVNLSKEEAQAQLDMYKNVPVLTPREQKMMAIYDAVVSGRKVIDLESTLRSAINVRDLPKLALAPTGWDSIRFRRTRTMTRKQRAVDWAQLNISFEGGTWSRRYEERIGRYERVAETTAEALVPSILPTVRDQVKPGDLILWEPVWTAVSNREIAERRPSSYDPMILRELPDGLWSVVAAWDLTDVEARVLGATPIYRKNSRGEFDSFFR